MKLFTSLLLAGLAFSTTSQAASVYAVSVNEISNFSMSFVGGSGSFSSFTFSNDAAANLGGGTGGVDLLDAPAACINCSYDNDFVPHTLLTDFSYGDAQILNTDVLAGTGAASAIAEARASGNGAGFAMGSNMLTTVGFQIDSDNTALNFSFDTNAYTEADAAGGAALSNMTMSIVLLDWAGSTVWSLTPAALNQTLTGGNYAVSQTVADGTAGLAAGNYSMTISMAQTVDVAAVPLPAALPLMLAALGGLLGLGRRNSRAC